MPDGSSSAAPVMSPGPSSRARDCNRSRCRSGRARYGRSAARRSAGVAGSAGSSGRSSGRGWRIGSMHVLKAQHEPGGRSIRLARHRAPLHLSTHMLAFPASLRFPYSRVLLPRTRLAYIHLRNLLTDAKRDRAARISGYVAVSLPDELVVLYLVGGEVANATVRLAHSARPVAIASALFPYLMSTTFDGFVEIIANEGVNYLIFRNGAVVRAYLAMPGQGKLVD